MGSEYIQGIAILIGINLIAVLGLSILTGFTGLFSFGHGGFMAIGAYIAAIFTDKLHLPFWQAIVAGALAAGLVSLFIGRLTLKLKGDYFCIATMGFGEAVRVILNNCELRGRRPRLGEPAAAHHELGVGDRARRPVHRSSPGTSSTPARAAT